MILLIGLNHKTAPLAVREKLFAGCQEKQNLLSEVLLVPGVQETLYISTCNRIELIAVMDGEGETTHGLKIFLAQSGGLTDEEVADCFYVYRDVEAIRHLFRVSASLDSQVMGETQILGQVKEAYRQALTQNATGLVLNRLLHRSFRTAKRVRTETAIAANPVSVSFAAVELAKKIFGSLAGKKVLLIGAGEMAELTGVHLIGNGAEEITVANRSPAQGTALAEKFHGKAISLENIGEALIDADIVISSTGAAGFVVSEEAIRLSMRKRKNRLLFLIDIAVPRDIEPSADRIENVYLYNIDNLQDIVDENMKGRQKEALKAEAIVEEEVVHYNSWIKELEAVPTIVSLRAMAEGIVQSELEKYQGFLQKLSCEDREKVDNLIKSVVNKILHTPVAVMKEESSDVTSKGIVDAARQLFRLDE
jgi:glutamyl-tRNA reductase